MSDTKPDDCAALATEIRQRACVVCTGDCAGANPPITDCPKMADYRAADAIERQAAEIARLKDDKPDVWYSQSEVDGISDALEKRAEAAESQVRQQRDSWRRVAEQLETEKSRIADRLDEALDSVSATETALAACERDAARYRLVRPMLDARIEEAASGRKGLALRPRLGRTYFDKAFQVPPIAADEILNAQLDDAIDAAMSKEPKK